MSGKLMGLPILMAAAFSLANPGLVQAQSYAHIDRLAVTLQRQTAELHREVHQHFRPTPFYKHLDQDVEAMERLARHIHDVAHAQGSIVHLRRDVDELDRLYHHVEDLVQSRPIGRFDFRAVAHFRGVLADIGDTLHHLRDDLDRLARAHPHGGNRGFGFQVPLGGRGGFSVRFPQR